MKKVYFKNFEDLKNFFSIHKDKIVKCGKKPFPYAEIKSNIENINGYKITIE